jgi:hypothetical protein
MKCSSLLHFAWVSCTIHANSDDNTSPPQTSKISDIRFALVEAGDAQKSLWRYSDTTNGSKLATLSLR